MKRFISIGAAVLLAGAAPLLGAGKITTVAQVASNQSGQSHVLVLVDAVGGASLAPRHALYHKAGVPNAPGSYARVGVLTVASHPNTVAAQFALAEAAGFEHADLEQNLDEMLGAEGAGLSLAEKFLTSLDVQLPSGLVEQRRRLLMHSFPQCALPLGQGYIAVVPTGVNTFEVRNDTGDEVIGRATVSGDPMVLPAVGPMSERVDTLATGHLTVALRWCLPDPLKKRALHFGGFNLYRVRVEDWQSEVGGPVPLNMDRALLLTALQQGLVQQVNRSPVTPAVDFSCPINPADETYFFIDANDSKELLSAEGGDPFINGDQVVYFTAAVSHVKVIGEPSPGLPVTVCDRLPPTPPADLRVENHRRFDEAANAPVDYLEVNWKAQPEEEIAYYCVHRYGDANAALQDRAAGNWPHNANLVAIIPNQPDERGRVRFGDDGTNDLPAAAPHPVLPDNANQTFWYTVCAVDQSACTDADGYGNFGAPSGAVPAALYRSDGPGSADGRITVPCCELTVNAPQALEPNGDARPILTGRRNSARIVGVDFAAARQEDGAVTLLASVPFPDDPAVTTVSSPVNVADMAGFKLMARFHTNVGRVSKWKATAVTFSAPIAPDHEWTAQWLCESAPLDGCGGIVDPVDPGSGDFADICVALGGPPERAVEIALHTRIGNGPMIRRFRGPYEGPMAICFSAPATPGEICVFSQTFDKDGNPGVVFPLGCVETIGHEGYPTPIITFAESVPTQVGNFAGLALLRWASPASGVHRFEIKVSPPIPGATRIVHEAAEAGVIKRSWSYHDTPSLLGGFGNGGSDFERALGLIIGETHTVCVRAVGPGEPDLRAAGDWSDARELIWSPETGGGVPPQDGVAFPIRPVPGDSPVELLSVYSPNEADIVLKDRYIWVEVGELDPTLVERESIATGSVSVPAILTIDDIEPYLFVDLPLVGYLQRTDVADKPAMQCTHFIDEILTESTAEETLTIIDESFRVARKLSKSTVSIWLRMAVPPAEGGAYRATILQHHPDRETRAVYRANPVQIP